MSDRVESRVPRSPGRTVATGRPHGPHGPRGRHERVVGGVMLGGVMLGGVMLGGGPRYLMPRLEGRR
jgi:hypothetical protein